MDMTKEEYKAYVQKMSPRSPLWRDMVNAFWIGGLICVVGQLIMNGYGMLGLDQEAAGSATSATLVFVGAFLTGLNLYHKIAKVAGAGTLVPITGFANSVVAPAMEYKAEGIVTGTAAKIFTIAGPVLVFGIFASAVYGAVLMLLQAF